MVSNKIGLTCIRDEFWAPRQPTTTPASHPSNSRPAGTGSNRFEPLRVALSVSCRHVTVLVRKASHTVATFKASTTEIMYTNSLGGLHCMVGPEGDGDGAGGFSEGPLDTDCGDTESSDDMPGEDDVHGARCESSDAHEQLDTDGQDDDRPDQAADYYGSTCDADNLGNLLDDLPDDLPDDLQSSLPDDLQGDVADDLPIDLLDDLSDNLLDGLPDDLSDV